MVVNKFSLEEKSPVWHLLLYVHVYMLVGHVYQTCLEQISYSWFNEGIRFCESLHIERTTYHPP
jgi:hypothetical protein